MARRSSSTRAHPQRTAYNDHGGRWKNLRANSSGVPYPERVSPWPSLIRHRLTSGSPRAHFSRRQRHPPGATASAGGCGDASRPSCTARSHAAHGVCRRLRFCGFFWF